ncbi:hypothetical protein Tco_1397272, partial [Tanacetum coccineum]
MLVKTYLRASSCVCILEPFLRSWSSISDNGGIQFATAQLPLLELMDCGMTICEPDAQSPFCEANSDSDSQVSPNSKLHLIPYIRSFFVSSLPESERTEPELLQSPGS